MDLRELFKDIDKYLDKARIIFHLVFTTYQ